MRLICLFFVFCFTPISYAFAEDAEFAVNAKIPMVSGMSGNPSLYRFYNDWFRTPYLLGGTTKSGIDCSSFVQQAFYAAYRKKLPRTTELQAKMGKKIHRSYLRQGDLVFFYLNNKTAHVGIYLGDQHFMHASTSKGVIISKFDSPFWLEHFTQARRIN